MPHEFKTKDELLKKASSVIGRKIGDYDIQQELINPKSKGNIGHVMEKGFFGYDINNKQAPDFENLGIELKVTGYKWVNNNKQVSAKERLVITMIDYFKDINTSFYKSHLFEKINNILLLLYEYDSSKKPYEYVLTSYYLYEYENIPEKDKLIIEQDWDNIMNKIRNGLAHELSEGDTLYLGACPKGANKRSITKQPYSSIAAMKRAYSLKTTYMTYIFRTQIFNEIESRESFIKDLNILKSSSFEEIVYTTFSLYIGKTLSELDSLLTKPVVRENNKQYLYSYTSSIMNIENNNINSIEEFNKANIQIKTIRVNKQRKIKESMSFPSFDFIELAEEKNWEESSTREMFSSIKFLFVVFEEIDDSVKEYRLKGVKLWNIPDKIIENEIKAVWEQTRYVLNENLILNISKGIVKNNFPKIKENRVSHVRPHASNRSVTSPLPTSTNIIIENNDGSVDLGIFLNNHEFTKQCFWLNSTYILEVIKDLLD